jgi:hypothetical protein
MGNIMPNITHSLGEAQQTTMARHRVEGVIETTSSHQSINVITLDDIFDLITSINNDMSNRLMQLELKVDNIVNRLEKLESHNVLLTSAIAIDPSLRGNAIREVNTGKYTSNVMHTVPAALIFSLWRVYHVDEPVPVSYDYLARLFKSMCENYDIRVRKELGSIFSVVMDSKGDIKVGVFMSLLSDTASTNSAIMRSNILHLWSLLSTTHAPFIPASMHTFIQKFTDISNSGEIVYSDTVNKKSKSKFCQPGIVYKTMGPDWLMKVEVMKIIKEANQSNNYMARVVKSLSNGKIPTNEELGGFHMKQEEDMLELLSQTSISRSDIKRSSTKKGKMDMASLFGD